MNTDTSPAIDRIIKLLKLAKNNNQQGEMESAMAKAIELATKEGIDIATIEVTNGHKQAKKDFTFECVPMGKRFGVAQADINQILISFFKVRIIRSGTRDGGRSLIFVGQPQDIAMAKFVSEFLTERFMSLWHAEHKRGMSISGRASYFAGLSNGLYDKLEKQKKETEQTIDNQQVAQAFALAVVSHKEELNQAVDKFFPKLHKGPARTISFKQFAYNNGYSEGQKININKPLSMSTATAQLH